MNTMVPTPTKFGIWSDRPLSCYALKLLLEPEFPTYVFHTELIKDWDDTPQKPSTPLIRESESFATESPPPKLAIFELSPRQRAGLSEASQRLKLMSEPKMLILTSMEDSFHIGQVLATGAMGCLSNRAAPEEIVRAMRQISQGNIYISDPAAQEILCHRSKTARKSHSQTNTTDPISQLTQREFEVFQLFGKGLSTKQIAHKLSLNIHTIETYRERIRMRIHARDGSELIYRAIVWCVMND